jgi:hypothetical protein
LLTIEIGSSIGLAFKFQEKGEIVLGQLASLYQATTYFIDDLGCFRNIKRFLFDDALGSLDQVLP